MKSQRIVIIGAGSPCFGANLIADVLASLELRGGQLMLVDIDAEALDRTLRFVRRANEELELGLTLEASASRRELFPGADFVISAIGVETIPLWECECDITQRHGIHYAWCGLTGPAGLMRTLRMVPPRLAFCRDIEELCPEAWLLNYANPVSRLGYAISRYSAVKTVGLCHALAITARHLASVLGVRPDGLHAIAAGINHFSFITDLRYAESGEDAYPALREALRSHDPADQPLSRTTFGTFGLYPVPDDREVSDYLGYCHSATHGSWEKYGLQPLDWAAERARREA